MGVEDASMQGAPMEDGVLVLVLAVKKAQIFAMVLAAACMGLSSARSYPAMQSVQAAHTVHAVHAAHATH